VPKTELLGTLRALVAADVRFVVVGGVAAILAGAILNTRDVDVVCALDEDNLTRLAALLARLDAVYRDPAGRRIEPTMERLRTQRVNLLSTDLGDLDVLHEIGNAWRYETLVPWSRWEEVEDMRVLVLGLGRLIEAKEIANRPKDRAALFVLRHTLEMRKQRGLPT
jgi:hypothetical protein